MRGWYMREAGEGGRGRWGMRKLGRAYSPSPGLLVLLVLTGRSDILCVTGSKLVVRRCIRQNLPPLLLHKLILKLFISKKHLQAIYPSLFPLSPPALRESCFSLKGEK